MTRLSSRLLLIIGMGLIGTPVAADPITTTLEGCVSLTDPRLSEAQWFAPGTFQAVAFDDEEAGCAPTIAHPVLGAYIFDENRIENTLTAWLNLENLPSCGRRQYDLHYYLEAGVLDPFGLKSLVIDTGVSCVSGGSMPTLTSPPVDPAPEPGTLALLGSGIGYALWRRRRRRAEQPR